VHTREGPPASPRTGDGAKTDDAALADAATLASDTLPAARQSDPEAPPILPRGTIVGRYVVLGEARQRRHGRRLHRPDPELERDDRPQGPARRRRPGRRRPPAPRGPRPRPPRPPQHRRRPRRRHDRRRHQRRAVHRHGVGRGRHRARLARSPTFVPRDPGRLPRRRSRPRRGPPRRPRPPRLQARQRHDRRDGRARVMDFGLARASESAAVTRPDHGSASTDPGATCADPRRLAARHPDVHGPRAVGGPHRRRPHRSVRVLRF
jgi:hypothetical protein